MRHSCNRPQNRAAAYSMEFPYFFQLFHFSYIRFREKGFRSKSSWKTGIFGFQKNQKFSLTNIFSCFFVVIPLFFGSILDSNQFKSAFSLIHPRHQKFLRNSTYGIKIITKSVRQTCSHAPKTMPQQIFEQIFEHIFVIFLFLRCSQDYDQVK